MGKVAISPGEDGGLISQLITNLHDRPGRDKVERKRGIPHQEDGLSSTRVSHAMMDKHGSWDVDVTHGGLT